MASTDHVPPERIKINILNPIHTANNSKLPETSSTTEISKFTIKFHNYTLLKRVIARSLEDIDDSESDDLSLASRYERVYQKHIYEKFRKAVGVFLSTCLVRGFYFKMKFKSQVPGPSLTTMCSIKERSFWILDMVLLDRCSLL